MDCGEFYKAIVEFKQEYGKPPDEVLMHPRVYDDLRMDADDMPYVVQNLTPKNPCTLIYGIPVKEDARLPIGLVRYVRGKQTGQLWLKQYQGA